MYFDIPDNPLTTTKVKIKYDCCGKELVLKWRDAEKNFQKNNGKHICRTCWLKSDANPAKKDSAKEKAKKTNLDKYGTSMPMNSQENIEKRREQFKNEEFKAQWLEKHKQSNLERYGVEHQMFADEVKEKVKQTNLERYGVEVPMQNPEILAKAQATNLERYGSTCSLNNPSIKTKALKSLFEHYGVEYYNQLPEMKDYLRENCKEWLAESYANPWAKGITRPEEWNQKQSETVCDLIEKGKWDSGPKNTLKGWYTSKKCLKQHPMFRSSYELIMHRWLDLNEKVEYYDYEPFGIPYTDAKGSKHNYYPDFIVKFLDDNDFHIIEVKSNYAIGTDSSVALKEDGVKKLMEEHNILKYEIWGNEKIKSLDIKIEQLIEMEEVELYKFAKQE